MKCYLDKNDQLIEEFKTIGTIFVCDVGYLFIFDSIYIINED